MSDDAYESWQEWVSERQAILQFEAGIPPDKALAMAIEMRVEWVCDLIEAKCSLRNNAKA